MSIPPALLASGRSSYRSLLRASAATFRGDERVLQAFQQKARQEFVKGRSITDVRQYEERIKLAQEVSQVIRTNLVQAEQTSPEEDTWSLRMTKDTELGDNNSIKNPKPVECGSKRKQVQSQPLDLSPKSASTRAEPDTLFEFDHTHESTLRSNNNRALAEPEAETEDLEQDDETLFAQYMQDHDLSDTSTSTPQPTTPKRLSHNALVKLSKSRTIPQLDEKDLEETFIRGSGPGGQSINKTANNVSLLHKPTGIRVTCQYTRSLQVNRRLARRILVEKLDRIQNPGLTKEQLKWNKERERKRQRAKKARKKAKAKAEAEAGEEST